MITEQKRQKLDELLWNVALPENVIEQLGYTKLVSSRFDKNYGADIYIARNKYSKYVSEFIIDDNEYLFPERECYRKIAEVSHEF